MGHSSRRNFKRAPSRIDRIGNSSRRNDRKGLPPPIRRIVGKTPKRRREIQEKQERDARDALFRTPGAIAAMVSSTPPRLGPLAVKLFLVSCHGSISRTRVFRVPDGIAAFDLAENEYRGLDTCSTLDQPLFDVMIGPNGSNIFSFFNAMLGGKHPPDPLKLIPQIGYRTPGDLMYDFKLSIYNDDEYDFNNAHGCWDITDTLPTFNPHDFTYRILDDKSPKYGNYVDPNVRRQQTAPGAIPYKREGDIRDRMASDRGIYASEVCSILRRKYPNTACFIMISSCAGISRAERNTNVIPAQPPAHSHYALNLSAIGHPPNDLVRSLKGREPGYVPHPNTI